MTTEQTTTEKKPTLGEQLFTLSALCSLLLANGIETITAIGNSIMIRMADDAGVDRAFSSLVATHPTVRIVKDPHEHQGTETRVRMATLCLGGHHIFLEGPVRPVLKAV